MIRTRLGNPVRSFGLIAVSIVAAVGVVVRTHLFARNPDVAAWGATFDLTITIPAMYYLIVVRSGRARPMTVAPVFVICAAIAAAILPRDEQSFLHQLRVVAAPLDIITIVLIGRRIARMRRNGDAADAESRIRAAAASLFGESILADLVASELAIAWYGLFFWRRKVEIPAGMRAVTVHERSGWGSIVACVVVLVAAESLGTHLLIQLWSVPAAWIMTALDLYGVLWLFGDYNALRLRPTLVGRDRIELRYGLRWTATIARENIAAVERVGTGSEWRNRGTLKMAIFDEPRFVVRLREPVVAKGLAGIRKTIHSIAVLPDDEAAFAEIFGI